MDRRSLLKAIGGLFGALSFGIVRKASVVDLHFISASQQGCVGTIKCFNGNLSEIPNNWKLCDGSNGTADLRYKFVTSDDSQIALAYIQRVA